MQGRQGPGDEQRNKALNQRIASLNGTGHHQAIPQRPAGMPRVDQPPVTTRVTRPQHQAIPIKNSRRRLLILGSIFLACAVFACTIGFAAFNYFAGLNASSSASNTATDFLGAISNGNYDQAYRDLGPAITLRLSPDEFKRQAQNDDRCYGSMKNFSEVANSATSQDNSQSYSYTITRSKSTKTYQMRLALQPDQEGGNGWKITDYGNDLGPTQSAPSCK